MQQQTVLVVAQHGRFLAQQAHNAGHRVLVADCFGDLDTLAIAEQWLPISDLHDTSAIRQTLITLSQNQLCLLVYGSGIEDFSAILTTLPDNIQLLGNALNVIENVKTPALFFSILQHLNIPHPNTKFTPPNSDKEKWLCKPNTSFGGQFITHYDNNSRLRDCYYQQYVEGKTGSVLFLADGKDAELYLINQQFQSHSSDSPFLLSGITTPFILSDALREKITAFIALIVAQTKLCGFNSLDFIVTSDDKFYVLEINPRISASAALLDESIPIFERHFSACMRQDLSPITEVPTPTHLHTFFAPYDLIVPEFIDWPGFCHDLPHPNTVIKKGRPICTALIETSMSFKQSEAIAQQTLFSLLGLLENNH